MGPRVYPWGSIRVERAVILASDIGGTKTTLAVLEVSKGGFDVVHEERFPSRHYGNLHEILGMFLSTFQAPLRMACFGIAGPVKDGRCVATNLPWEVDVAALKEALGLSEVWLINDLEASAYGVGVLEAKDFVVLNEGAHDAEGNAAIIAAGTGLGEAGYYWDGKAHHPFACEGGHADFAPRDELEMDLLRYMLGRFATVSYERVLSGPGLYNIYQFFRDTGRGEEPDWLAQEMRRKDPSAVISTVAFSERNAMCMKALDLFVSLYGGEAGNLALKVMATGGVYVGGGIAPRIIRKLRDGAFMRAFIAKGRMRSLLEAMPVRVIRNEKTALLGAAHYARVRKEGKPLRLHGGR